MMLLLLIINADINGEQELIENGFIFNFSLFLHFFSFIIICVTT